MLIASSGHVSTHTPQSIHVSLSTLALASATLIASLGHSDTQVSQPVHFATSTFAGIYTTLSTKTIIRICKSSIANRVRNVTAL
jgi:hypothetical protein